MFISKEKLNELIDDRINLRQKDLSVIESFYITLIKKLNALEDYLGIHYEEKTTTVRGYVKNNKK